MNPTPFQTALLDKILKQKLPLELPEEFIHPYYEGASILNIPTSIVKHLSGSTFGHASLLPEIEAAFFPKQYQHIALVLVDGLGYDWLYEYLQEEGQRPEALRFWHHILSDAVIAPLTSISPSTTAAALSTFWTGRPPVAHGILGYEVWLKEFGILANMILHSPAPARGAVGSIYAAGFDPTTFLPVETIGPHLKAHGVKTRSFQHISIVDSGLSSMLDAESQRLPYKTVTDMWFNFEEALLAEPQQSSYNWLYWGDHDGLGHRWGVSHPRLHNQFEAFGLEMMRALERLRRENLKDTLILITADHGHLVTPRNPRYDLLNYPDMMDLLAMDPSGDNRLPYFYASTDNLEQVKHRFYQHWTEEEFEFIPSQAALEAGLFGTGEQYQRAKDRIGDWLVLPKGTAYLWWSGRPDPLHGRHGGLSRTEMLVPLIAIEV
ncbi:MAG: alkaline phosphatase family protein [Anaerolineae bacterium]|jgi:hypothetical protein|nr:alkaline phosphatase family protein [Anaerolineae bacterium]